MNSPASAPHVLETTHARDDSPARLQRLSAIAERLLDRPSVARVIEEARPWFRYYPFADRLPARYRDPG